MVDLARVGGAESGAYDELYRRHENAARNVARYILRSRHDADDVVNDAFAGVIAAINHGAGPRSNFRHYLMACVRNGCKARRCARLIATDPATMERHGAVFEDPDRFSEAGIVANAFAALSIDWQQTLWLTAVEEQPTDEVARQLGRRPSAVAALAHRAREAFAEAYLAQHQARSETAACERISPKLAHYVRGNASEIDTLRIEQHLMDCVACSRAVDELRDLNASLRSLAGPGPMGAGGIAAGVGAAAAGIGATTLGGWTLGALSGAALVKAAIIAALLIPAAIITVDAIDDPSQRITAADAASGDDAKVGRNGASKAAVAGDPSGAGAATDPSSGEALTAGDAVDGADGSTSQSGEPAGPPTATTVAVIVSTPQVGAAVEVGTDGAGGGAGTGSAGVEVTIGAPGSGGGDTATVSADIGSDGIDIAVAANVPILDVPIDVDISLPPLTVAPVTVPGVTIPPITVPPLALPGVTTPEVTVTPEVTTAPIELPGVTIPLPEVTTTTTIVVPSLPLPTLPGLGGVFG